MDKYYENKLNELEEIESFRVFSDYAHDVISEITRDLESGELDWKEYKEISNSFQSVYSKRKEAETPYNKSFGIDIDGGIPLYVSFEGIKKDLSVEEKSLITKLFTFIRECVQHETFNGRTGEWSKKNYDFNMQDGGFHLAKDRDNKPIIEWVYDGFKYAAYARSGLMGFYDQKLDRSFREVGN